MRNLLKELILLTLAVAAVSCGEVKQVVYFQDTKNGEQITLAKAAKVAIRPSDQLTIVITSKTPELAAPLNLGVITHQIGSSQPGFQSSQNQVAAYTVDSEGNIEMPMIGTVHVGGLCRDEVAALVKSLILSKDLLKDPTVIVDFSNMYVSVFGDVKTPGRVHIDKDRMTVLDVLAKAGDLNVSGVRQIKLFREVDGVQQCYELDLNSAQNVFQSPAYYVMQDDVVYVIPNAMKARSSTVNGNNLLSTSFWLSVGSLGTSIAALIVNCIK